MLLAEYEKIPATDKCDQSLADGRLFGPEQTVAAVQRVAAVPRSHRQMATMHLSPHCLSGALLLTNNPRNKEYILEALEQRF